MPSPLLLPSRQPLWKPAKGAVINYEHPLVRSLRAAYLMNEAGGTVVRNLVKPADTTSQTAATLQTGVTWGHGPYGPELVFPQTPSSFLGIGNMAMATSLWSAEFLFKLTTLPTGLTYEYLWAVDGAGDGLAIETSSAGIDWTGPNSDVIGSSLSANTYYHVVLAYNNSSGATTLYLNGAQTATGTTNPVFSTTTLNDIGAGGGTTTNSGMQGSIVYARIWDGRLLTANEALALYKDPFGMFVVPAEQTRSFALIGTPPASGSTITWVAPTDSQANIDSASYAGVDRESQSQAQADSLSTGASWSQTDSQANADSIIPAMFWPGSADHTTHADTFASNGSWAPTDNQTPVDSSAFTSPWTPAADSQPNTDSQAVSAIWTPPADLTTLADSLSWSAVASFLDVLVPADSYVWTPPWGPTADHLTNTDSFVASLSGGASIPWTPPADTQTLLDSAAWVLAPGFTDLLIPADAFAGSGGWIPAADSQQLTDSIIPAYFWPTSADYTAHVDTFAANGLWLPADALAPLDSSSASGIWLPGADQQTPSDLLQASGLWTPGDAQALVDSSGWTFVTSSPPDAQTLADAWTLVLQWLPAPDVLANLDSQTISLIVNFVITYASAIFVGRDGKATFFGLDAKAAFRGPDGTARFQGVDGKATFREHNANPLFKGPN